MDETEAPPAAAPPRVIAQLFDGGSARRREVALTWNAQGLTLAGPEIERETVAWEDLAWADRNPDGVAYAHRGRQGWRLRVPADAPSDLVALLPRHAPYGRWIDRLGLGKATVIFGAVSAAVAAAVLTAPTWLGPMVPEGVERRIGDAMVGDLERFTCHTPASDAALARLTRELDTAGQKVRVQIAKVDMVNAVALPGGRVLLFDGLIQDAKSGDEVAGVLGHEIGHVRERHVMQALLRQFGLSILLSGANSDVTGTLGGLAAMGYSRSAEAEADDFARARLAQSGISPKGTADFFARLRKDMPGDEREEFSYFASHPNTKTREQKFLAAVKPGQTYAPALTPAEWSAIRGACKADKAAEEWSLFGF